MTTVESLNPNFGIRQTNSFLDHILFPHFIFICDSKTGEIQNLDFFGTNAEERHLFECNLGAFPSLPPDDDTLAWHTGRRSFEDGSLNLIVRNVPSGAQRTSLPHPSSLG